MSNCCLFLFFVRIVNCNFICHCHELKIIIIIIIIGDSFYYARSVFICASVYILLVPVCVSTPTATRPLFQAKHTSQLHPST